MFYGYIFILFAYVLKHNEVILSFPVWVVFSTFVINIYLKKTTMKILLLTGSPSSYSVRRIVEEAETRKHEIDVRDPRDLMTFISSSTRGHDRVYEKSNKEDDVRRILAKTFDVVIPRFAGQNLFEYGCSLLEHLNGNMRIPSTQWAFGLRIASNKFLSVQAFSQNKVQTMRSIFAYQPHDTGWVVDRLGGFPIVCKTLAGSQGQGVFILNDALSASTTLGAFHKLNINILLQEFIDSGKPASDIRAYVVGNAVVAAYKRFSLDDDFRSNYSMSKSGEPIELNAEQIDLAIRASHAVGLEGVCAIDMIVCTKTKKTFVIEANGNGNLKGIEKITGVNVAKKIVLYAEKISKKPTNFGGVKSQTFAEKESQLPFWKWRL